MSNLATITNNILADSGIDDINVVVTTGSYSNPAWIISLAWTKITGAPAFVTNVTATSPLFSSGGATPNITIQQASSSQNGFLSSTDWNTFNSKVSSQWVTSGINIYYNTGNVTIGGTSPTERLSVQGNTNLGNSIADSAFTTRISGFAVNETESVRYGNYGFLILNSDSGYTASARRFVITNAFNTNKFAIIRSVDANTDPALGNQGFVSSGTPDFVISNVGNVGINNPNPAFPLDVIGTSAQVLNLHKTSGGGSQIVMSTTFGNTFGISPFILGVSNGGFSITDITNSNAQRLVIQENTGNIGVGISSPAYKLSIQGNAGIEQSEEYFYFNSSAAVGNNARAKIRAVGSTSGSGFGGSFNISTRAQNNVWNEDALIVDTQGNVGIATITPNGNKLRVNGTGLFDSTITATQFIRSGGTSSQYLMADGSVSTLTNPVTGTGTTNYLPKFTGASTIGNSAITEDGSMVTLLSRSMTINAATNAFGELIYRENGDLKWNAYNDFNTDNYVLGNSGGSRFILTQSGNLGIGSTTPSVRLHVQNSSVENPSLFILEGSNTGRGLEIKLGADGLGANGSAVIYNTRVGSPYGEHIWQQAGTQRMRLDTSGNLMVGSANAGNAGTINVSVGVAGTTAGGLQLWASTAQTHYVQFGDGATGGQPYAGYIGYAHSSDSLIFGTATSTAMTLGSNSGLSIGTPSAAPAQGLLVQGSVGIGVSPSYKLHLKSTGLNSIPFAVQRAANTNNIFYVYEDSSGNGNVTVENSGGTVGVYLNSVGSSYFNGGNVGIGTTSPTRLLEVLGSSPSLAVIGTSGSVPQLQLVSGGVVNWSLRTNQGAASDFTIYQDSTERIRITSTGNVGIGTASPERILTIYNSNSATLYQTPTSGTTANSGFYVGQTGDVSYVYNYNSFPLVFATANTERMRITSGGDVGIGNWSTNVPQDRLHVNGAIQVGFVDALNQALRIFWNGSSSYGAIQTYSSSALTLNPLGNNVLIGTTTDNGAKLQVSGGATFTDMGRFGGWYTNGLGPAAEVGFISGSAYFFGYNRTTGADIPVQLRGSQIILNVAGVDALTIAPSTGAATFSSSVKVPSSSTGGLFEMGSGANSGSRSFRLASDVFDWGDFGIQVSNSQTGTTYTNALLINRTGEATFSSSVTTGSTLTVNTPINTDGIFSNVSGGVIGFKITQANPANDALFRMQTNGHFYDLRANTSNDLSFDYDGNSRMRIFSSGNVFIGASPSDNGARLQVNGGDLRVQGNTDLGNQLGSTLSSTFTTRLSGFALRQDVSNRYGNYGVLILNADSGWTSSARRFMITNGIGANKFGIIRSVDAGTDPALGDGGSIASGTVDFEINNAGAATFSSSLTAGVGSFTGTSAQALTIHKTSGGGSQLLMSTTFGNTYGISPFIAGVSNGGFSITDVTNNAQRIVIQDGTGNVGINISSPGYRLSIQGNAGIEQSEEYFYFNSSASVGNNARGKIRAVGAGGGSGFGGDLRLSSRASNNVWNEDVLTIANTGEVLIGTTTPNANKLRVNGNTWIDGNISATGDVIAFASSDRRLKDNITSIKNPLQKINKIGGYSFTWNSNQDTYSGNDYGVVAQEIEEIFPELVRNRDNGYKAVKYEKLIPLLIESIKELSKEVEILKQK